MATQATSPAEVREKLVEETQKKADEQNKTRTGKGTRLRVGQTRGKNPQVITWEAFDESKLDTLPSNVEEFLTLTNTKDEKIYLSYLIGGYNDAMYTAASDPIAEFVNPAWPDEVQKTFRVVVRNYANGANVSIEDAVALIKPGIEKSQAK
jgi:hypothetical protein